jgi:F420-non-reducing hydrogenase iron-sulfur subunit
MFHNGFEPRIVGFLCNWCSYQGADMAGTARVQYPTNVHVVRVNCSGRVDPSFILKAFREGADGVLVAGCHPGDCHYTSGNYKTMRRMPLLERVLADFGIEPARFRLEWVSAAEGARWARVVSEMTEQVRKLGPLNWTLVSGSSKLEAETLSGGQQLTDSSEKSTFGVAKSLI